MATEKDLEEVRLAILGVVDKLNSFIDKFALQNMDKSMNYVQNRKNIATQVESALHNHPAHLDPKMKSGTENLLNKDYQAVETSKKIRKEEAKIAMTSGLANVIAIRDDLKAYAASLDQKTKHSYAENYKAKEGLKQGVNKDVDVIKSPGKNPRS